MKLRYNFLPKKMQYDFYINISELRRDSLPCLKDIKDLDYVKRYYGYSNEKQNKSLKILTKKQLNFIKSKFDTGGAK